MKKRNVPTAVRREILRHVLTISGDMVPPDNHDVDVQVLANTTVVLHETVERSVVTFHSSWTSRRDFVAQPAKVVSDRRSTIRIDKARGPCEEC